MKINRNQLKINKSKNKFVGGKMKSLDELEKQGYNAIQSPKETNGNVIKLEEKQYCDYGCEKEYTLNGEWEIVSEGNNNDRLGNDWKESFKSQVPCDIHNALFKAGIIPDPTVGDNQKIAREYSFKTWWLRREFDFEIDSKERYILRFDGVVDVCTVWLNGKEITRHQGMFGGPTIDITNELKTSNTLIVKLDPIKFVSTSGNYPENDHSWKETVVINNVYGWHYSNMPSIGIWQPVSIKTVPNVKVKDPFIFTRNAEKGQMSLCLELDSSKSDVIGELCVQITEKNSQKKTWAYSEYVKVEKGQKKIQYEFSIPEHKLWWPVDLGEQNLYDLTVSFVSEQTANSVYKKEFGIRTVEMGPIPKGEDSELYNWTFIVNGKKSFIKGTGWCTMDALLELTTDRYERFISLASEQHIQMVRGWGCGLPETDVFYEMCDKYGIMVMQEWPTAWDSHNTQPYEILEETVIENTLRLRNYPSLVMYGAGNESPKPFGKAIDMMGRLSIELDGTRPFHRGEPWGGSKHDYGCYWDRKHLDHHLTAEAIFWGEFGLPSLPIYESVQKYMPKESINIYPLEANKDFVYHTPVFGHSDDLSRLKQFSGVLLPENYNLQQLITSSQIIQSLAVRRVLERSRTRFPECTGALYYKMNDNFPAISWACVDWYGAPKISHYVFQDSFEPLHVCVLFSRIGFDGNPVDLPVYLLDDSKELDGKDYTVKLQAYGEKLTLVKEVEFKGNGKIENSLVGKLNLTAMETANTPLFVVADIIVEGELRGRSFYFNNFESKKGCIFNLPRTGISYKADKNEVTIINKSNIPAVGVWVSVQGQSHVAKFSDNFVWINAGECKKITISGVSDEEIQNLVQVDALNIF